MPTLAASRVPMAIARCQDLARLCVQATGGAEAINARDRAGKDPKGASIGPTLPRSRHRLQLSEVNRPSVIDRRPDAIAPKQASAHPGD